MGSLSLPGSRRTVPGAPAEQRFRQKSGSRAILHSRGQTRPRKSWRGKHHRIWTSLPYSSRATTPWLSIMSGRDGRPLWWTMPERVKKTAEHAAGRSSHDYENLARFLLEMDWSWLGYTSYRGPMYSGLGENTPLGAKKPYYPQRLLPGNGTHDGSGQPEPGYLCLRV